MTDIDQCAFEEALRSDLNSARQEAGMLRDQLREANTLNEALSYKVDFLTAEVSRVTVSREQYERISIRVSTVAESVVKVAMGQLEGLMDEIKAAAFTQVPGAVKDAPTDAAKGLWSESNRQDIPATIMSDDGGIKELGTTFGPVFGSASLLPPAQIGNGEVKG